MRLDIKIQDEADFRAVTYGTVIELLRQAHGWSQGELAKHAKTTQATISRVEKGLNAPSPQVRLGIAAAFGLQPSQLEGFVEQALELARARAGEQDESGAGDGKWWQDVLRGLAVVGLIGLIIWAVATVLTEAGEMDPGE